MQCFSALSNILFLTDRWMWWLYLIHWHCQSSDFFNSNHKWFQDTKQVFQHGPLSRMENNAFLGVTAHDIFNDCYRTFRSKVLLVIYYVGLHLVYILWKGCIDSSSSILWIQNSELLFFTSNLSSSFYFL